MFLVTTSAKQRLKEGLQKERSDEETLIRIGPSASMPGKLSFFLDKEKPGDTVVGDDEGERLLLIGQDLAPILDNVILDFGKMREGEKFTLTRS